MQIIYEHHARYCRFLFQKLICASFLYIITLSLKVIELTGCYPYFLLQFFPTANVLLLNQ